MIREKLKKLLLLSICLFTVTLQADTDSLWGNVRSKLAVPDIFKKESKRKRMLPALPFMRDYQLKKAAAYQDVEAVNMLLPKVKDLDRALDVVDGIHDKKELLKNQYTKDALIFGLYRSENWIHKLLKRDKDIFEKNQTEELLQKYKDDSARVQEVCRKFKIREGALLLGYRGVLDEVVDQIADIERKAVSQGYTTFVHAHRWQWNFLNDAWNMICAVRKGESTVSNKFSLRQRDDDCDVQKLYDMREEALQSGANSWGSGFRHSGKDGELVFMNRTIFSSFSDAGESTGYYFFNNHDQSFYGRSLEIVRDLLKKYNLGEYIAEMEDLYELHKSSNTDDRGELFCLSVRNDLVDKRVYAAVPGGKKDTRYSDTCVKVTSDRNRVHSEKGYFDDQTGWGSQEIYCFAVPDIPGEYGKDYYIDSVHVADPKRYQEYRQKKETLFQKMLASHKS